jgi:hypothetical protein
VFNISQIASWCSVPKYSSIFPGSAFPRSMQSSSWTTLVFFYMVFNSPLRISVSIWLK